MIKFVIMNVISKYDVVIIGSGIAGLSVAKAIKGELSCCVITKGKIPESATAWAQGGIACAMSDDDSWEKHFKDTIEAGHNLCDSQSVEILVKEGPNRVRELIEIGACFDKEGSEFDLGREGAHSCHRILHSGDETGYEIEKTLGRYVQSTGWVTFFENGNVVKLITKDRECIGCIANVSGNLTVFNARFVVLATGGGAQVYSRNTVPKISTGDGVALAYSAGADICDMEFFQFHPTAFYSTHSADKTFLISEAIRGAGARLLNTNREPFMSRYNEMGDLAPRDVVSSAIFDESKRLSQSYVYLDFSELSKDVSKQFPNIYKRCLDEGFDLEKEVLPVSPAAHYMIGGVWTDLNGQTSLPGLFAVGEVASVGVHGANRLASNSLLEGLVYGNRVGHAILGAQLPSIHNERPSLTVHSVESNHYSRSIMDLQTLMWKHVGVVRNHVGIEKALDFCNKELKRVPDIMNNQSLDFHNMLLVSRLMCLFSINRTQSLGCHVRSDNQSKKTSEALSRYKINRERSAPIKLTDYSIAITG